MNEINFKLKNQSGIYSFINLVNGKRYVGSSVDLYNRLHEHYHNLKNDKAHNKHLQAAWNKYGEDNFMYNIIEFCDSEVRFEREQYYIDTLKPEYNLTLQVVANFGHSPSQEVRDKISETLKNKYANNEIQAYRQEHNWKKVWIYNIQTFTLECECECSADACRLVGYKKSNFEEYRVYSGKYIMVRTPFQNLKELRQYIDKYINCANSRKGKYLVIEDDLGNLQYFKGVSAVSAYYNVSKNTLGKHLEATKKEPYILKKLNLKFYFTDEYIPVNYTAVPIEKSSELLSGNIGESPVKDNTEINSEIAKGSESSYSVESE